MFIINPEKYMLPAYRISPFRTSDVGINHRLPFSDESDEYLAKRFGGRDFYYTRSGKQAINMALKYYNLHNDDVVTILTTTGNFYISCCVTGEIEKFCRWSRKIEENTKVILVNHEFGYPYKETEALKGYGLPIIEDCAHTFFSQDPDNCIGNTGDFVIYSFPKMFPVQLGGLLVSNHRIRSLESAALNNDERNYVKSVLSFYITRKEEIIRKRLRNYRYMASRFNEIGFPERFETGEGIVPGVFMFRTDGHNLDLPEMKKYLQAHGIECSVFYGEEAFFIPVHQALDEADLDYFVAVVKSFANLSKGEKSK